MAPRLRGTRGTRTAGRGAGTVRALAALVGTALWSGCSPGYILRAGWEEARILGARRPIHEVVHDTTTPAPVRDKLRLVQDARTFADRSLELDAGEAFTSYVELDRDTLLMVVNAAYELRLAWKTWWFPIVGSLPYRGYFDFDRARDEAEKLREAGYDTWVRPASAFSTLGWFPDPLMSTTLRADSVGIVETVIHEITHSTFFPKGQARFNESFANFVGHRGAIEFFCDALRDENLCRAARDLWHDTRVFGRFFHSLFDPLEELYASDLPADSMRAEKRRVLRDAAARFESDVQPDLRSGRYRGLDPESVNNAWLLSRMLYYTRLDDLEELHARRGELGRTVRDVIHAARGGDPWDALDRLLAAPVARAPATPDR